MFGIKIFFSKKAIFSEINAKKLFVTHSGIYPETVVLFEELKTEKCKVF